MISAERHEHGVPRNSGIEFLRIMAMLAIVAGHFAHQGGVMAVHGGSLLVHLFGNGALLGVNLFLLVGCWFMVDARFRWERPLRLYATVVSYTVPLTVIALACGAHPSVKDVLRGFLPFSGRALWFASAYISLMALTPWLSRALNLPKRSLVGLVALLTVLVCGVSTLPDPQTAYLCNCLWFVYVYLFVGCLKRHFFRPCGRMAGLAMLACAAVAYSAMSFAVCRGGQFGAPGMAAARLASQYLHDCKTFPNFLVALLVFLPVVSAKSRSVPLVNWVAKPAFAVYVIHQTPAFFPFLWKDVCRVGSWVNSPYFAIFAVATVLGVYAAGCILEPLRAAVVTALVNRLVALFSDIVRRHA